MLFVTEEHVPVIRYTVQDARQAGSADSLLARKRDFDAAVQQRLCGRLIGRNLDDPAGFQLNFEAAVRSVIDRCGLEELTMNAILMPATGSGCLDDMVHEALRPTDVKMCADRRTGQHLATLKPLRLRPITKVDARCDTQPASGEPVLERDPSIVPNAVVHLERRILRGKLLRHGQQRCDTNAAGKNLVLATCWPFDAATSGPMRYLVKAQMLE